MKSRARDESGGGRGDASGRHAVIGCLCCCGLKREERHEEINFHFIFDFADTRRAADKFSEISSRDVPRSCFTAKAKNPTTGADSERHAPTCSTGTSVSMTSRLGKTWNLVLQVGRRSSLRFHQDQAPQNQVLAEPGSSRTKFQ